MIDTTFIIKKLARPLTPGGRDIDWQESYLIFTAENGRIAGSVEEEEENLEILSRIVESCT